MSDQSSRVVVWVAVGVAVAAGLASAVVVLRGDPGYLVQGRHRGGATYGDPAPVPFGPRALAATVLAASLGAAGARARSDRGLSLWPVTAAGCALFALDIVTAAAVGPAFPMLLALCFFSVTLPVIAYAEPTGELARVPPWVVWGAGLLALATPVTWLGLLRPAGP